MGYRDIDFKTLRSTTALMPTTFRTKDVSEHPNMRSRHQRLAGTRNYHADVGRALSAHRGRLGLTLLSVAGHARGALWNRATAAVSEEPSAARSAFSFLFKRRGPRDGDALSDPVRRGHFATVKYMRSPAFLEVKKLFESVPEFGGVYFHPLEDGVRVVDLHEDSPKPRIGIGNSRDSLLPRGTVASQIAHTISARIEYLDDVRARQAAPSLENQLEAGMIRRALRDGLKMDAFPATLRFIHSQWRIDRPGSGAGQQFTDLIAVDIDSGDLVIVELKATPDASAAFQVAGYVDYFTANAASLLPLFTEIARMMGQIYACPELETATLSGRIRAMTAWPDFSGRLVTTPVTDQEATAGRPAPTSDYARSGMGIGPQYSGDTPLRARLRLHQSWYRAEVLRVPYGPGPRPTDTRLLGSMLSEEAAEAGANFLTPQIFHEARRRIAAARGAVEPFRLLRNMLSSQPMAFNLFAPVLADSGLATRLMRAILPGEVAEVTDVRIEYAPQPSAEYLGDRTAFDAFVEYRKPDGAMAFVGIETKLTEPFSPKAYDGAAYRKITEGEQAPWLHEAWPHLSDARWNQLWRNHMLVEALARHPAAPHGSAGRLLLLHHPLDQDCRATAVRYQSFLRDPDATFLPLDTATLIDRWRTAAESEAERAWLDAFDLRYHRLEASEAASGV